jgi:surface protein
MFNVPSFFGFKSGTAEPFEFTINTVNTSTGSSNTDQFKLPLTTSTGLNCTVYWGDGTYDNITNHLAPEVTHTYASSGVYTVKITGSLLGWRFSDGGDKLKMLNISKWSGLNISSAGEVFWGCTNLTATATDAPLITTTNLSRAFQSCTNFNGAIGSWNTSSVTNMISMFQSASSFNQNIGSWNTSLVTSMASMFNGASVFNQNIGAWNTANVTNFSSMFSNATAFNNGGSDDIDNWTFSTTSNIGMGAMFQGATAFNRYIGSWNTERVTNMSSMFRITSSFDQNIGSWNVQNVTTFDSMFRDASAFDNGGLADINNWTINTTAPVNMNGMFSGNNAIIGSKFNQPIDNWNTSTVNNMVGIFSFNTEFNQNISSWNVGNVASFQSAFQGASAFNQPIGSWDVSNCVIMTAMFSSATAFNQDISDWNVSNVANFANFMAGKSASNYSAANLDSIYNGWSSLPSVQPNLSISFGTIKFTAAGVAGKAILTGAPNNWTIVDGGI